jgi:hypothetical protein
VPQPDHPALRYQLGYVLRRQQGSAQAYRQALYRLLEGPMAPHRLVSVLEQLVQTNALTRREATQIEDKLLTVTSVHGTWDYKQNRTHPKKGARRD